VILLLKQTNKLACMTMVNFTVVGLPCCFRMFKVVPCNCKECIMTCTTSPSFTDVFWFAIMGSEASKNM
jgi:hypothetical protein